ncbi:phage tail tape measure protein [Candidatus Uhrbacteria bacterium]|nr:phage tail tape measure protein [Candidatus Uhrbacteria bacterium]
MAFGTANIVGELGVKITGYTADLESSLKNATKEIKTFGLSAESTEKIAKIAFTGIAAAATALAAGLTISVKNAVEFEKGMTNIATIVDTNTESLKDMGNAVLDISKRTPVQISELTATLYEIRDAGISADDAMEVLEKSAQLGVVALGTTAEAADIVTSAVNAFKLNGEETQKVYGYVFEAAKAGKTNLSELANGFGSVAAMAAQANIELPEYLSAVAALTTTGLPASQANAELKSVIAGVTREGKELTKVLDNLEAKSFKELMDKKGGMVNAFKAITESVKNDDAAIISIFGSIRAYNAVVQLSGDLNGVYNESLANMENGAQSVTEAFEKQKATVSAQWQTMKNNLEALSIQVGSALLPALNQALQAVTAFIDKIPAIVDQLKDWVENNDWVQGALIALGSILTGLAISVIPSLVVSLGSLIATVAVAAAPFVAIGLLITAIYVAIKNWDQITAFVQDVWNKVVDYTMKAWEWMKPYVEGALRVVLAIITGGLSEAVIYFVQNWDKIKQAAISFWEWIKPYVEASLRAVLAVITFGLSELVIFTVKNWDQIKATTIAAWEGIKASAVAIWNAIVGFLEGIWQSIKNLFNAGLDAVNKAWTTTWNGIKDFAVNTWTSIKDLVNQGIEAVAGIFQGGISIIGNAWRSIWDNVVNIVTGVFNTIQNTVNNIISWVQRALDKINIFKSEQASVNKGSWAFGGYTFGGVNQVAGIVHGGEWVAPAWMVDKYSGLIGQLEAVRTRGFKSGGHVRNGVTNNNQRTVTQNITQNIREGVDFSIAARELSWRARFS